MKNVDIKLTNPATGQTVKTTGEGMKEAADRSKGSFRQTHELNIREGFVKASFKKDKISVHYRINRRGIKEDCKPTIHDCGHNDLYMQRHELAETVLRLMGAPDSWQESGGIQEIKQDPDTLDLKFKIGIVLDWHPKPFVLETPALNDLTFNDIEPLIREIAQFVTGAKRSQQEFKFSN